MKRLLAILLIAATATPALANTDKWGPDDLRRVLANWLEQQGTNVPLSLIHI